VLCDGLGGMAKGEEAAVLALSVFVSRVLRTPRSAPEERLRLAAIGANDAVYRMLRGRGGATIAAVMGRKQGDIVSLNVGDSRIYGIGESRDLKQISKDDTLAGYLGQGGAMDGHQNQLVQFVGMGEGIEPNIFTSRPNTFESLLVTSDGIHNVPPQAFSEAIRYPSSNYDLADRLLSLSDSLGGRDNATVVLLPTQLKHSNNSREQGLTLEFLSVSDRLEIWIPAIAEDSQHQDAPKSLREASGARIKSEQEPAPKKKKETKVGARQIKSKKVRKHGRPNHPDQPVLDITFPQKGEN
jgi:PPM family protein phosphatase